MIADKERTKGALGYIVHLDRELPVYALNGALVLSNHELGETRYVLCLQSSRHSFGILGQAVEPTSSDRLQYAGDCLPCFGPVAELGTTVFVHDRHLCIVTSLPRIANIVHATAGETYAA